jgi:hypothetical protein
MTVNLGLGVQEKFLEEKTLKLKPEGKVGESKGRAREGI